MTQTDPDRLFLHEQIILLALRDEKGTFICGSNAGYAMAGAALSELLLMERVEVQGEDRKARLVVLDSSTTGDLVLDECLAKVAGDKPRSPAEWIPRFVQIKDVAHRVALGLADRGILKADHDKVLLIFSRRIYPEVDPAPEREIIARMHDAIFGEDDAIDPLVGMLVAVAHGSGLLYHVFDRKDLKSAKPRLERIASGDIGGEATTKAVQAMQAAATTAAIIAASTVVVTS